jgi:predicted O-linked N-acetylglucosamine transferase (SPINDLY family)
MQQPKTLSLRLLLACARAHPTEEDEAAIRRLLDEDVDWTHFAQKAIDHGLAGLAGHTLAHLVPDRVPGDILEAFGALIAQTRESNHAILNDLFQLVDELAAAGVEAISFKGPALAMQAFGDLGLRGFRDLDFLIADPDLPQTIKTLDIFGYRRSGNLTAEQYDLIHRLQGQEILFKPDAVAVEPHTRLTPLKMALDIDYDGLWRRAQRRDIGGRALLTFSPEDTFLVLAIHGGKELWWDVKWACDVADFAAAHPQLDWNQIATHARAQGCHRMLLVATSLARNFLGAGVPDFIAVLESSDPVLEGIVGRIVARWEMDDPGGPPSNKTVSMDRLRLHDGPVRQISYILRTVFLPGPQHIALAALPRFLEFAYIPIGLAHDFIALPLYRAWGNFLTQADRIRSALALSPVILALTPVSSKTRMRLMRLQRAYRNALEAVATDPKDTLAWTIMGDALSGLKRFKQAICCYDKALAIVPDNNSAWKKRSMAIAANRRDHPECDDEPEFDSQSADGWALRTGFLLANKRYSDASQASQRALQLDPDHKAATQLGVKSRLYACDWRQREEDRSAVARNLESGAIVIRPINLKQIFDSEELGFSLARLLAKTVPAAGEPLWRGERYQHKKIRLAYLSTDFRNHPVGWTIVAPLEHHDKGRFEITAISLSPDDGSDVHRRIETSVDRFVNAHAMSDMAIAKIMRQLEIDIAIDLNGLTGNERNGILVHRPAPLQVNYLGYPGTMAAPFIDYIIADPVLIPDENRIFYSEKIAYLPNTYLPCDDRRKISGKPPSRADQGLPDTGFVFACFNNLHKLGPEMFSIWMRLLQVVEGSVLWLSASTATVKNNLRREATARGVAPERLVFARFEKDTDDHLARQCLAGLFLDTLPYNAHSTAGEALWAGLPLLTCRGQSFQGRVAASLLHAIGLPELITTSLADYEQRALELVRDPQQLAAIRQKLARNRDSAALFDTASFTRGLESVYATMQERQGANLPPESFSVADGR